MDVLRSHEKFGQSAKRCIAALTILSSKIMQETSESGMHSGEGIHEREGVRGVDATEQPPSRQHIFEEYEQYSDMNLEGLSFDAGDLSFLNVHAWELMNQP